MNDPLVVLLFIASMLLPLIAGVSFIRRSSAKAREEQRGIAQASATLVADLFSGRSSEALPDFIVLGLGILATVCVAFTGVSSTAF